MKLANTLVGFLAVTSTSLIGCHSGQVPTSAAKSEAAATPSDAVWRMVPADGIEQYVTPGHDLPGWTAALNGVWYCHFSLFGQPFNELGLFDGAVLLTLNNAVAVPAENKLTIGTYYPRQYAFNPGVSPYNSVDDKDELKASPYVSYDVTFKSPTEFFLTILTSDSLSGPKTTHSQGYSFSATLDAADPDHFHRHSSLLGIPMPDYELYRIVDGEGHRTKHYEDVYKADIASSGTTALAITVFNSDALSKQDIMAAGRWDTSAQNTDAKVMSASVPGSNKQNMKVPD